MKDKKPSIAEIDKQIDALGAFIENSSNDWLEKRIAQVMEETLRWSREEATDWDPPPVEDLSSFAQIIRSDFSDEIVEFLNSSIRDRQKSENSQ